LIYFFLAYESREFIDPSEVFRYDFFAQLDKASVKWLEEYLIAHTNVTCLIVSHDSG